MKVRFREVDPFNCWIWLCFPEVPSQGEKNYVEGLFDSWYVIGRMGGFNAGNLQSHEAGVDLSCLAYDNDEDTLPALMHNVAQLEYQANWARCWVDLGTSDLIAIDILINVLKQMDVDVLKIEELIIGGVNQDWPVEEHPDAIFSSTD